MVKFGNNERSRLCCISLDGTLSICDVTCFPPSVLAVLKGHKKAVSGESKLTNSLFIKGLSQQLQVGQVNL